MTTERNASPTPAPDAGLRVVSRETGEPMSAAALATECLHTGETFAERAAIVPEGVELCLVEEPGRPAEEGYLVRSKVAGVGCHFIDIDGGEWRVLPAQVDAHLSIEDVRAYAAELRLAIETAEAPSRPHATY